MESVFERIKKEQQGRLDLLVNNAYSAVQVRHTQHRLLRRPGASYTTTLLRHPGASYTTAYTKHARVLFDQYLIDNKDKKFWELPPGECWDTVNNVGLR